MRETRDLGLTDGRTGNILAHARLFACEVVKQSINVMLDQHFCGAAGEDDAHTDS